MDIPSRVFARGRRSTAFSVIGMFGTSGSTGAQKTVCDCCGREQTGWYDRRLWRVRDLPCAGYRIVLELEVRRVACRSCGAVKRERLDLLADNPHFTVSVR
jgi:transposase